MEKNSFKSFEDSLLKIMAMGRIIGPAFYNAEQSMNSAHLVTLSRNSPE